MTPDTATEDRVGSSKIQNLSLTLFTFLLLGVLFPLGVFEIGLRMFWEGFYLKDTAGRYLKDDTLGWIPNPGFEGVHGGPEFKVNVTHNSRGFRGGEISPERVEGASRVLFIGDSMTYGYGVEDDETFVGLVEATLEDVETVNLAVEGYNTAQQYLRLKTVGLEFEPDLVVLCFFWNDVYWDNLDSPGPRFEMIDGELSLQQFDTEELQSERIFETPSGLKQRIQRFYVYRLISDSLKVMKTVSKDTFLRRFEEGSEDQEKKTWEITEALIERIAGLCEERGASFLLALVPDQVDIEKDAQVYGLPEQFAEIESHLETVCGAKEIAFVSPKDCLKERFSKATSPFYFHMNRHFTPEGNAAFATCLAPSVERALDRNQE